MTNPYRGEISIEFAGKQIALRPSMTAIVEWEEATKRGTMALAVSLERGEIKTLEIAEIIRAAAKSGGTPLTRKDVLDEIERVGLHVFYMPTQTILNYAFFGGTKALPGELENQTDNPAMTESSSGP